MQTETTKVHVDHAGDYVLVPEEDFDSLVRTLTLLANEEFTEQFEKSRSETGKSLSDLKEKYDISA